MIKVFSPTQKQPSPHVISSLMGMLTKKAVTRCLAVCCPCSVLNCVDIHCLTNPLLSLLWFPSALVVVGLTPLLGLKCLELLCGHFFCGLVKGWEGWWSSNYRFHLGIISKLILLEFEESSRF